MTTLNDGSTSLSSFVQLSQIHLTTNSARAPSHRSTIGAIRTLHHHSYYSKSLASEIYDSHSSSKKLTTDRHIQLSQDHFNQNFELDMQHTFGLQIHEPGYMHNNSHYSLPIDHDLSPIPTTTPPPPALPVRNNSCKTSTKSNTVEQRLFNYSIQNYSDKNNINNNFENNNNNEAPRRYR